MIRGGRHSFTTNIRMPDELRDRIRDAAASSGRSFNSEMLLRLMESFGMSTTDESSDGEGLAHFKIRLHRETLKKIEALAEANKRSVTAQIVCMLEQFIADHAEPGEGE